MLYPYTLITPSLRDCVSLNVTYCARPDSMTPYSQTYVASFLESRIPISPMESLAAEQRASLHREVPRSSSSCDVLFRHS